LKSIARRTTLSKNILLSNARDFYEFSLKNQLETADRSNKQEPGIHVFFLDAKEIQLAKDSVLNVRKEKLRRSRKWILL
jgi:hypothetical protein